MKQKEYCEMSFMERSKYDAQQSAILQQTAKLCIHHYVRDEEHIRHSCCQKCGAVIVDA